jgi:hypothetical protein
MKTSRIMQLILIEPFILIIQEHSKKSQIDEKFILIFLLSLAYR